MTNKSPVFPISDPQHFSDYGFDPQINYFQVLEEAMKHKRETARSIDSIHFKLQKPISKDESRTKAQRPRKKRWWRNALLFLSGAGPIPATATLTKTTCTRPAPGLSGLPSRAPCTGPRAEAAPPRPTAPAALPPGRSPAPSRRRRKMTWTRLT
ncbi:hypothetical protein ACSQ67_020311 [Phaseolus vulgaris]